MFPNRVVPMLIQCIATQRTHLASIFMYMDSQIPYTYTHLMTLIVKVHLLFVTAVAGTYSTHNRVLYCTSRSLVQPLPLHSSSIARHTLVDRVYIAVVTT